MPSKAITILALVTAATAHLHLDYPPTLKGDNNPHTQGQPDNYLNYPFGCCAQPEEKSQICKGHLGLLDTDEGKPTAVWAAGQSANFSLSGHKIQNTEENPEGSNHGGGSCQAGFSTDKGETFKVVKTWQGNCPPHDVESAEPADMTFDFDVPVDLPNGNVIFAWTWVNREQEFNMNCAAVTITGGNGETPEVLAPSGSGSPSSTASGPTPSQTQPTNYESPNTTPDQYTLEGCTCSCPSQTWSEGCHCYDCESPSTSRRNVERKALALHRRRLAHAERMKAPARRAEVVAFASRPSMLLSIDTEGAQCHSQGDPAELKFPDPGPDVVESPDADENPLEEPSC